MIQLLLPIVEFGERVFLWKPAKTVTVHKDEPKWRETIWMRSIECKNEHIIGTENGVVKCSSVRCLDEVGNFDIEAIRAVKGTPWAPVPGRKSLHIPTNIEEDGQVIDDDGNVNGRVAISDYRPTFDTQVDLSQDVDCKGDDPEVKEARKKKEPKTQEKQIGES